MSFLEIRDLDAGYGKAVVLRDVTLSVEQGESVAVVGRNGAGKTTLLQSIFGGTAIKKGTIALDGNRIDGVPGHVAVRAGLAISPQGRLILPNLTVRENLLLGAASGRPGSWTIDEVYRLFPVLRERASRSGVALSGGQQQMLAIGRALMANPRVLFLDEPSEGLSPLLIDELAVALDRIRRNGTGILIVEQHLGLVRRTTDRFIVLAKGQIIGEGATPEIDEPKYSALIAL